MKRLLFLLLLSAFSYALIAQTGPSKKCPTCGLSVPKCKYKGKHPKPKCSTCGKELAQCKYKGKHPQPATPSKPVVQQPTPAKPVAQQSTPTKPTTGTINGHEWVDLGLSVKWAICNVGANNSSDYGDYYAWGETRTKSRYAWDNCFDCLNGDYKRWGIYKLDGKRVITPTSGHDTARENWGGTWRMPTDAEIKELCNKCKWVWTSRGGHNGYVVTGPNGNSIFLPAAGYRYGTDSKYVGEEGYYWSSTLCSPNNSFSACNLYFNSGNHGTPANGRCGGFSVRPVID